ncbi:MAG: class I SAM-dependent methyltransferase [Thermodesulfobacteriota bacterium]
MDGRIDQVIANSTFRRNIYNMIPQGASRILDFGCGNGGLLFRLKRDKGCTELYGVEPDRNESALAAQVLEKVWHDNIERGFEPFEDYRGFFNYIVLHDVAEHLYDPWLTMTKIRELLADGGKILLATPNLSYWGIQREILAGRFPYGPGLWHTGHLRWYTPSSLIELLLISGLAINCLYLEIPDPVDLKRFATGQPVTSFQFPPPEYQQGLEARDIVTVSYGGDISKYCPVFYAHKLIADCGKGQLVFKPVPITNNCPMLAEMRKALDLPFDIHNPPPMKPLIGNWN